MQLFLFLFPLQHMKRPALHYKQVGVLRMAFRARKVFGTFEKRAERQWALVTRKVLRDKIEETSTVKEKVG